MYEMENSEYADPLLRRVEILEKDRGSLETALEIRTQELTQLRAQANEQVLIVCIKKNNLKFIKNINSLILVA